MTREEILTDMRGIFGRKTMLSPADIAEVISQSEAAQAIARHRGRFDIPLRKRGRNVYVSLHDLVDWLHTQEGESDTKPAASEDISHSTRRSPATTSQAGKPRRASLASSLVFARQALAFDTEVFAALEVLCLEEEAKKSDKKKLPSCILKSATNVRHDPFVKN